MAINSKFFGLMIMMVALALGGCASSSMKAVPAGQVAYELMPPSDPNAPTTSYKLSPNDTLSVSVFQEPDLSNDKLKIDDNGNIQMPLVGELHAAGRTASELAFEIASRLRRDYIVNPQVVVQVAEPAARYVTVEGQVNKPGVYEIDRQYTLISAIARAESPSTVAALDEIVVFRNINGQRMAARFDLEAIRSGLAPDPQIQGGDVVVVGFSGTASAWQDILKAAPIFNAFVFTLTR